MLQISLSLLFIMCFPALHATYFNVKLHSVTGQSLLTMMLNFDFLFIKTIELVIEPNLDLKLPMGLVNS
jgi:hypothetical protein